MLRFGKRKVAKVRILWCNNIVISNVLETKINSKYLIGYLDEVLRPVVLILL